jgi:hypothetical protein
MSRAERTQSSDLFGRYGDGSWTGVSLYDRFNGVEQTWPEGLARRQADFMRAWVHRLNNETLHLSAYSLVRLGSPTVVGGELRFRLGATEKFLTTTLWSAFWTYWQTTSFVFEHFGLRVVDELDEIVVTPAFADFAEAARQP